MDDDETFLGEDVQQSDDSSSLTGERKKTQAFKAFDIDGPEDEEGSYSRFTGKAVLCAGFLGVLLCFVAFARVVTLPQKSETLDPPPSPDLPTRSPAPSPVSHTASPESQITVLPAPAPTSLLVPLLTVVPVPAPTPMLIPTPTPLPSVLPNALPTPLPTPLPTAVPTDDEPCTPSDVDRFDDDGSLGLSFEISNEYTRLLGPIGTEYPWHNISEHGPILDVQYPFRLQVCECVFGLTVRNDTKIRSIIFRRRADDFPAAPMLLVHVLLDRANRRRCYEWRRAFR